jgi:hypothetical protein
MSRAQACAEKATQEKNLLVQAVSSLVRARAELMSQQRTDLGIEARTDQFTDIVDQFRKSGSMRCLARALMFSAKAKSEANEPASAHSDLDEAWEIAQRGPMRLHMADIHLNRARLFFREPVYPFKNEDGSPRTPADDLAAAEKLIKSCGYHRRDQELADAKQAILAK